MSNDAAIRTFSQGAGTGLSGHVAFELATKPTQPPDNTRKIYSSAHACEAPDDPIRAFLIRAIIRQQWLKKQCLP